MNSYVICKLCKREVDSKDASYDPRGYWRCRGGCERIAEGDPHNAEREKDCRDMRTRLGNGAKKYRQSDPLPCLYFAECRHGSGPTKHDPK